MTNAIAAALRHTKTMVDGATNLPVWAGVAPENAKLPIVLVQVYGDATDLTGIGARRVVTDVDVSVRVVGRTASPAELADAYTDIDEALHGSAPATTTDGKIVACIRTRATHMVDVEAGGPITYLGGVYRITVA